MVKIETCLASLRSAALKVSSREKQVPYSQTNFRPIAGGAKLVSAIDPGRGPIPYHELDFNPFIYIRNLFWITIPIFSLQNTSLPDKE